jgi:hypothetical protein
MKKSKKEELDEVKFLLIGYFVTTWARLEASLDFSNWIFLNLLSGGSGLAAQLPRSLDQKIALFRRAHEELTAMGPFRDEGLLLIGRINDLKERRHDIIHGRISSSIDGMSMEVVRAHLKGLDMRHLSKTYTIRNLIKAVSDANDLMADTALHLGKIKTAFWPK